MKDIAITYPSSRNVVVTEVKYFKKKMETVTFASIYLPYGAKNLLTFAYIFVGYHQALLFKSQQTSDVLSIRR